MTISDAAQDHPIVSPNPGLPFIVGNNGTGKMDGYLTRVATLALQQIHDYIVSMNRRMPCNATMASNTITLTLLPSQPQVNQYVSFEAFTFVAPDTSTGNVSAKVVTETGSLSTLKVYLNNGTRAAANDIQQDALYNFYYNDALDSGNGGFILDGNPSVVVVVLTDSSGGTASNTIHAVAGTGDDATINDNFASLSSKINAIIAANGLA